MLNNKYHVCTLFLTNLSCVHDTYTSIMCCMPISHNDEIINRG